MLEHLAAFHPDMADDLVVDTPPSTRACSVVAIGAQSAVARMPRS
jgi:hypothetical protein